MRDHSDFGVARKSAHPGRALRRAGHTGTVRVCCLPYHRHAGSETKAVKVAALLLRSRAAALCAGAAAAWARAGERSVDAHTDASAGPLRRHPGRGKTPPGAALRLLHTAANGLHIIALCALTTAFPPRLCRDLARYGSPVGRRTQNVVFCSVVNIN